MRSGQKLDPSLVGCWVLARTWVHEREPPPTISTAPQPNTLQTRSSSVVHGSRGHALLGTAVNAPPQEATAAERREWLALVAAALKAAGHQAQAHAIASALAQ